jgi:hypothetical protein
MFSYLLPEPLLIATPVGTSLGGTRPVKEFLALLKNLFSPDDFHLETLASRESVDTEGLISPGDYLAGVFMCQL